MGRKNKYTKEVKLKAINDYIQGKKTAREIAYNLSCSVKCMRVWLKGYNEIGESFFDDKKINKSYTKEFKLKVINEYLDGKGSYLDIASKYKISSCEVVRKWVLKYNNGIETKDYNPKSEVYTMKARITTYEERVEIVEYCNSNGLDYKGTAEKYNLPYSLVYTWTHKYLKDGQASLKYMKKGPNKEKKQASLSEYEKLKQEVERLRFENEVLKKKEYFAQMLYSPKSNNKKHTKQ